MKPRLKPAQQESGDLRPVEISDSVHPSSPDVTGVRASSSRAEPAMAGVVPWPNAWSDLYRAKGYWQGVTLGDAFDESVATHYERVAVVEGENRVTYGVLGMMVDRMARHLVELGLCGGERIVFLLPNLTELVVCYFACLKVGAIPVACLANHRQSEIEHITRFTEAAAWIITPEYRGFDYLALATQIRKSLPSLREVLVVERRLPPRGQAIPPEMRHIDAMLAREPASPSTEPTRPRGSDVAVFQLSGGTTGTPKVIPRTHDDYLYNSRQFAEKSGLDESSVLLVSIPAMHNFPLACPGFQGALLLGARVVLAHSPSPEIVFPLIERERVTWIPAVPATAIRWTQEHSRSAFDLSSIRTIAVGGQRLHAGPARALVRAFGPVLIQVFGMAEGLLCCTRHEDPADVAYEMQGRPICPEDDILIVDEAGNEVAQGALGELWCRGPYTIRGYYRAAEYNRHAFSENGYYRTGDIVRMHGSGNLVVEGRRKDVINRGGEKISAEEIEDLVLEHAAVMNAAVIAMPDPVLGERPCAVVVLREGASLTLEELRTFLSQEKRIAGFKIPERLEIRDRLPMTAVGKTAKDVLRAEIAALVQQK